MVDIHRSSEFKRTTWEDDRLEVICYMLMLAKSSYQRSVVIIDQCFLRKGKVFKEASKTLKMQFEKNGTLRDCEKMGL